MTHPHRDRIEREDLVMFINACFACTGQREFYGDAWGQSVSIQFLHAYIAGNYRALYARCLAARINHFNQGQILLTLLSSGAPPDPAARAEEGALIRRALAEMPPQRALRVLMTLKTWRVNNRRSRAVARDYLAGRLDPAFDAVKYRSKVRAVATHAHLRFEDERGTFLFRGWKAKRYDTPLFEAFRQAHYAKTAALELPYSIAAGLAPGLGMERAELLRRGQAKMTVGERLRLQGSAQRAGRSVDVNVPLGKIPLTKLCSYLLSLDLETRRAKKAELESALDAAARRVLRKADLRLGRVAAVLDRSYSSSGSSEKHRRPLAVALGCSQLLSRVSSAYQGFWTVPIDDELMVAARGQTDLAGPLLSALATRPDLVVIVSDGFDNAPSGAVAEVLRVFRSRLDFERRVSIVHVNPVFDAENYAPRILGPGAPTVGLRDAEDLLTVLGFARFAEGTAQLSELERYLAGRTRAFLREEPS